MIAFQLYLVQWFILPSHHDCIFSYEILTRTHGASIEFNETGKLYVEVTISTGGGHGLGENFVGGGGLWRAVWIQVNFKC